jgi:hypothetical protein
MYHLITTKNNEETKRPFLASQSAYLVAFTEAIENIEADVKSLGWNQADCEGFIATIAAKVTASSTDNFPYLLSWLNSYPTSPAYKANWSVVKVS